MRFRLRCIWAFLLLTACTPTQHQGDLRKSSVQDRQVSALFNERQHEILTMLRLETESRDSTFVVTPWNQGNTPLEIKLNARIDSPSDDPVELVRAFIDRYAALYHIDRERLDNDYFIATAGDPKLCRQVIVDQMLSGQRVYNARLTFQLEGKNVRSITGMFDPRPHDAELVPSKINRAQALRKFAETNGWPADAIEQLNSEILEEVVYDPYFTLGTQHAPTPAFTFREGQSPSTVISAVDGNVELSAKGLPDGMVVNITGCGQEGMTTWQPAVVDDPSTRTPAWVSFRHFGGARLVAATASDAVLALLRDPVMQEM